MLQNRDSSHSRLEIKLNFSESFAPLLIALIR
jgi:hypothetical protein